MIKYKILYKPKVREAFEILVKKNRQMGHNIKNLIESQEKDISNISSFKKGDIEVVFEKQPLEKTITVTDILIGGKSLVEKV